MIEKEGALGVFTQLQSRLLTHVSVKIAKPNTRLMTEYLARKLGSFLRLN
jgi:hypothetical protein